MLSNRTNLAYDVGEVEKLAEEELEGVDCVSPSMNTPVFDQRANLRLLIFLAQQWLLKHIGRIIKTYTCIGKFKISC